MRNALVVIAVLFASTVALGLDVGDKAPRLTVKEWIVGSPVAPDKPDGKTAYVVEFWATWCPPCRTTIPHLNKLHQKYKDKGLVIVGISSESAKKVRPFAKKMNMGYHVAVDNNRSTNNVYMRGVRGIPHAFVVGKDGKVVWTGHPMAGMDGVVAQVLASEHDAGKGKDVGPWEKAFQQALQTNDLSRALKANARLIELQPSNYTHVQMRVRILTHRKDNAAVLKVRRDAAKRFAGSAENLNSLAWDILTSSDLGLRDPELALRCAQEAVWLTARKNPAILGTLARAYYEICLLDKAIAVQKEAIAGSKGAASQKRSSAALKYYESVKALQKRETGGPQ